MKLTIHENDNVAYLLLGGGEIVRSTNLDRMGLIVDWDGEGGIVGIEFLHARAQLGTLWDKHLKERDG